MNNNTTHNGCPGRPGSRACAVRFRNFRTGARMWIHKTLQRQLHSTRHQGMGEKLQTGHNHGQNAGSQGRRQQNGRLAIENRLTWLQDRQSGIHQLGHTVPVCVHRLRY